MGSDGQVGVKFSHAVESGRRMGALRVPSANVKVLLPRDGKESCVSAASSNIVIHSSRDGKEVGVGAGSAEFPSFFEPVVSVRQARVQGNLQLSTCRCLVSACQGLRTKWNQLALNLFLNKVRLVGCLISSGTWCARLSWHRDRC